MLTAAVCFGLFALSCKKEKVYITETIPGPMVPVGVVKNPYTWTGPMRPGDNNTFGTFTVFNQSIDSVLISSIEVTIKTAEGNQYHQLSVYTDGANSYLERPRPVNMFSLGVVIPSGSSKEINIGLGTNIRDTGTVQIIVKIIITRGTIKDTLGPVAGNIIPLRLPTLESVKMDNWGTPSQFIAAHNSAVDAMRLSYWFETTGGELQISALKFAAVGTNTASSIRINGVSVPFVNGVAYFPNMEFWSWGGFEAFVSYPSVGTSGLVSGTNSQVILTAVTYSNGLESKTINPNLASNTMKLVASKPTIGVLQPDAVLQHGLVHAIDVTATADPQGDVVISSIPIQVLGTMFGSVLFGSGTDIVVKDENNQVVGTTSTSFSSGNISKIIFTQSPLGYRVAAGTTVKFKIFVPVTYAGSGASIQTSIVATNDFVWIDVDSGSNVPYAGTSLMQNYPYFFMSIVKKTE